MNDSEKPRLIETRSATIERKGTDLLEVRFKPEVKLDVAGIQEVLAERKRLCPEGERDILAVFPPEIDFDIAVLTKDHYNGLDLENCTRSLALAANSPINERLASLFYAYFPQAFETRVFPDEKEAVRWLSEQAVARSRS